MDDLQADGSDIHLPNISVDAHAEYVVIHVTDDSSPGFWLDLCISKKMLYLLAYHTRDLGITEKDDG